MDVKELYIDSVEFSYDNYSNQISGAYLNCHVGEIVALFGKNGSGKSTLLKIIFGSLKPSNSYMLINGRKTKKAYLTRKIGYLPQGSFLPSHEKVSNLIDLLIDEPKFKNTLLNDERIQPLKNSKIYQLSGGELRYLEVWLLICQPTDFLLLDEPFTGIEPIYITYIIKLIESYKDKKGFIIADHNYNYLLDIATHIILIENGSCRKINHKKELEHFYLPKGTFDL